MHCIVVSLISVSFLLLLPQERAIWLLVGYGLARFNLRAWARDFWIQACGAEHKVRCGCSKPPVLKLLY